MEPCNHDEPANHPDERPDPLSIITVVFDEDEGSVAVNIGDLDVFSAFALLRVAMNAVWDQLPDATIVGDTAADDDEEC